MAAPRTSTWNKIAPLVAGLLIIMIVFAWVFHKKREDDAARRLAENAAQEQQNRRQEEEARRAEEQRREAVAQRIRDAQRAAEEERLKNQLVNWVRQTGTTVSQSATRGEYHAGLAADGNHEGKLEEGSVSFALPTLNEEKKTKETAWWMADLGEDRRVTQIMLHNCTDPESAKRLSNFRITIVNENRQTVYNKNFFTDKGTFADQTVKIEVPSGTIGRYFRIKLNGPNALGDGALTLAEVEVQGPPPEKTGE